VRNTLVGIATALVAAAALATAGPAGAATTQVVARYDMNETPGSAVLVDGSGNGLNGTIGSHVVLNGSYHSFPNIKRGNGGTIDPQHLDVVNSARLNPGTADFTVTVRLRIPSIAASAGNVMQKGQTGTKGGFWKIQLDDGKGRILCDFVSPTGSGGVWSAQVIADNRWHTVTCQRSATQVSTTVDGITTRIAHAVGDIANTVPLTIGGKGSCTATPQHDCDYFIGSIDYVEIQSAG